MRTLVDTIYKVDEKMILKTNGGDLVTDMKAMIKVFLRFGLIQKQLPISLAWQKWKINTRIS